MVAGELCRRGMVATTLAANAPDVDILAMSNDGERVFQIQVKAKTTGDWRTSEVGKRKEARSGWFWVLVDLTQDPDARPIYYVVPDAEMLRTISIEREAYLRRNKGKPGWKPTSRHSIRVSGIQEFKERWDLLGLS